MAEQKIITYDDINEFWPFSKNVDTVKVSANILRAQQSDLKPVLGGPLYFAFVEDFDGTVFQDPIYVNLFSGGAYPYEGENIYFAGIRPLLAAYSYNRIVATNKINIVRAGVVVKSIEQSETATDAQGRAKDRKALTEAARLEGELLQFLNANRETYPLFDKRVYKRQKRTAYNFYRV